MSLQMLGGSPENLNARIIGVPSDPREFANRIFHTCYIDAKNFSVDTGRRAKELSEAIGRFAAITYPCLYSHSRHVLTSYHIDLNMDTIVTAASDLFSFVTGVNPDSASIVGFGL